MLTAGNWDKWCKSKASDAIQNINCDNRDNGNSLLNHLTCVNVFVLCTFWFSFLFKRRFTVNIRHIRTDENELRKTLNK